MAEQDITAWIQRLHDADEEAAHQIWMAYFPKLVNLARKKMADHPRRHADEEDVALSAFNSFFRGAQAGRFKMNDRDDLWKLLTTITLRKVSAERRRMYAQKRGGGRVRGESAFLNSPDQHVSLAEVVMDENHIPEFAEDVAHMCDELLSQLDCEKLRKTAVLKMEGFTNREIADQMGCSVSRIKQRLTRIRQKWHHELGSNA